MREEDLALLVTLLRSMTLEPIKGLSLQFFDLDFHSIKVFISLLLELRLSELNPFSTMSEPSKEEGENWHRKESFLSFLAVLIHGVSHKREVDLTLREESIFLVVTMRMNHSHQHVYEFSLGRIRHLSKNILEMLHCERLKQLSHSRLLLLFNPNLLERLEE